MNSMRAMLIAVLVQLASVQAVAQQPTEESAKEAFQAMVVRLRAPIIDQALDVCLSGENAAGVVARAQAVGWPQFKDRSIDGVLWRTTATPASDSGKVSLGVSETRLGPELLVVACTLGATDALSAAFRERMQARFGDGDGKKEFSVTGGKIVLGGTYDPRTAGFRGAAQLDVSDGNVVIQLVVGPIKAKRP